MFAKKIPKIKNRLVLNKTAYIIEKINLPIT